MPQPNDPTGYLTGVWRAVDGKERTLWITHHQQELFLLAYFPDTRLVAIGRGQLQSRGAFEVLLSEVPNDLPGAPGDDVGPLRREPLVGRVTADGTLALATRESPDAEEVDWTREEDRFCMLDTLVSPGPRRDCPHVYPLPTTTHRIERMGDHEHPFHLVEVSPRPWALGVDIYYQHETPGTRGQHFSTLRISIGLGCAELIFSEEGEAGQPFTTTRVQLPWRRSKAWLYV